MLTAKRLLAAGAILATAATLAACSSTGGARGAATPASRTFPDAAIPDEGAATTTSTPTIQVGHYRLGQTANFAIIDAPVGTTGAVAPRFAVSPTSPTARKLQVVRAAYSRGDDYNHPSKGLYLGLYAKYMMVTDPDESLTWNYYVVVNGHHYDESSDSPQAFDPWLFESNSNQHAGETVEGWMTFDVPARHGTLITVDAMSNAKIAEWSF